MRGTMGVLAALAVLICVITSASSAERQRTAKPRREAAAPAQIICATGNGCLEVPRGCIGQTRPNGHSNIAVVLCDNKK